MIATITLNRPKVRNALSQELRHELQEAVGSLDADQGVKAVILTGTDPAFCSGVDLEELREGGAGSADIEPLTHPLVTCGKPLIGAVNGAAYTGGLELALACHFLVASERATFADTHARFGLLPGWGMSVLLAGAIGRRRATEMSLTCQPIDAPTALAWGLVNRVVLHQDLLGTCQGIAESIARNDPTALVRMRRLFDEQAAAADRAMWQLEARAWSGSRLAR